ncbi:MAG: hypothetical protein PHQ57_01975, partial [Candidatus Omnitrophica bacterium]|nr:hypothetical protein [Candidatus Omnitrophota bacterium]
STALFYNDSAYNHLTLDADSNPPHDVPQFLGGFSRGVDTITLPSEVTQQDLKDEATGEQDDTSWANGIYVPRDVSNNVAGGIYIKGDASTLTMSVVSGQPVYTITQGGNTKKVTVDYANNRTTVANVSGSGGTPPGTYTGIPNGVGNEGIIVYDQGNISNFSGTVEANTKATVTSSGSISISSHVMYQNYHSGSTPDAIGYTNTLGILAWDGDVSISTSAPPDLNIHGIVMAPGQGHVFKVDSHDDRRRGSRGTVTLLGGVISDYYGAFNTFSGTTVVSGYARNFVYDSRMLEGGTPPYFPYLTNYTTSGDDQDVNGVRDLDKKLTWEERGL